MSFHPTVRRVWRFEISLILIVETRQRSNITHGTKDGSVDEDADDDCSKDAEDQVREQHVIDYNGRSHSWGIMCTHSRFRRTDQGK